EGGLKSQSGCRLQKPRLGAERRLPLDALTNGLPVWPLTTGRQVPESRRLDEGHRLDSCPGSRRASRRSPLRRVRFASLWARSPATMIGSSLPHLIQPAITIHYTPVAPPMSPSPPTSPSPPRLLTPPFLRCDERHACDVIDHDVFRPGDLHPPGDGCVHPWLHS